MFQYYYILLMYYELMFWLERAGIKHILGEVQVTSLHVLLENVDRKNE